MLLSCLCPSSPCLAFLPSVAMSSSGFVMKSLSSHQSPNVVSTLLDNNDIKQIQHAYRILDEAVLKVPSIF